MFLFEEGFSGFITIDFTLLYLKPYEALNEECGLFFHVFNRVFSPEFQGVETGSSVCVSPELSETAGCSVFVSLELS